MSRTLTPTASPARIQWAIDMHGHSAQEAADVMGITKRALNYWLSGEHVPTGKLQQRALNTYLYGAMQIEKKVKEAWPSE